MINIIIQELSKKVPKKFKHSDFFPLLYTANSKKGACPLALQISTQSLMGAQVSSLVVEYCSYL